MGGIHKSLSIQFKGDNISRHAAVLSVPAYMFGVLSVTITIRFKLKQKSCNSVWQFNFGLKEKEKKNSLKSYVVHLVLQFSDNVRTFFSKCNTKRPVDLFTNTVNKENNLVLEAVTWCLEGTQQVSVFLKHASFLLYSKRILTAIFVSIWILPVSWKTRVMVPWEQSLLRLI